MQTFKLVCPCYFYPQFSQTCAWRKSTCLFPTCSSCSCAHSSTTRSLQTFQRGSPCHRSSLSTGPLRTGVKRTIWRGTGAPLLGIFHRDILNAKDYKMVQKSGAVPMTVPRVADCNFEQPEVDEVGSAWSGTRRQCSETSIPASPQVIKFCKNQMQRQYTARSWNPSSEVW